LAQIASKYFQPEQIEVIGDLAGAITYAVEKVSLANQVSDGVGAVLVTGSVVTAGSARAILRDLMKAKP
jgi:dihydrofolate synthase/folylpolyglutamate synthase